MRFPFHDVVGQEDVKLALLLAAVDPAIGGVLLRGEKGSAKSTLARGLAGLLADDAPFVELPVGATEDRVVGALDIEAALTQGEHRFRPGLLAAAHGGVLYVDEVNLLPDHLVDVLLDVAVSGVNRVERDGISHSHPSRFVLIGSMNPEEGDLRPQLLDRFGLAVDVTAPTDPAERAEIVRRRLAFDRGETNEGDGGELRRRLRDTRSGRVPDDLIDTVTRLCVSVGAEGLRADLVICRAAAALAGWEGRSEATVDDVRRVAPLALAHRRRRSPLDDAGIDQQEIDDALQEPDDTEARNDEERVAAPDDPPPSVVRLSAARHNALSESAGRRSTVEGPRGRLVDTRAPDGIVTAVAVAATAQAAAVRRALDPDDEARLRRADLREAVREQRAGNLIVLAVDASGSMGAERRMEAVKGAVVGLLLDAYQRRDRVALVSFRGDDAAVALRPTSSVEVARARLAELPTGGRTPLAAGLLAALDLATTATARDSAHRPLVVLVSDGRATAAPDGTDPVEAAHQAALAVRRRNIDAVVLDAEDGHTRLGLARDLAATMNARYLPLAQLTAAAVETAIREAVQ
ncbi:MAG TPA: AAA family ATPase [Acidimicrobiales bacterium]|nr:AAA family ATPase [Acidimicrobiales bacterium]